MMPMTRRRRRRPHLRVKSECSPELVAEDEQQKLGAACLQQLGLVSPSLAPSARRVERGSFGCWWLLTLVRPVFDQLVDRRCTRLVAPYSCSPDRPCAPVRPPLLPLHPGTRDSRSAGQTSCRCARQAPPFVNKRRRLPLPLDYRKPGADRPPPCLRTEQWQIQLPERSARVCQVLAFRPLLASCLACTPGSELSAWHACLAECVAAAAHGNRVDGSRSSWEARSFRDRI